MPSRLYAVWLIREKRPLMLDSGALYVQVKCDWAASKAATYGGIVVDAREVQQRWEEWRSGAWVPQEVKP